MKAGRARGATMASMDKRTMSGPTLPHADHFAPHISDPTPHDGMLAALFAWLQFDTYHDGAVLRAVVDGHQPVVFRLVGISAALRWFLLIVIYGTFIPNTWERCAAVVGVLALIPIALMMVGSQV